MTKNQPHRRKRSENYRIYLREYHRTHKPNWTPHKRLVHQLRCNLRRAINLIQSGERLHPRSKFGIDYEAIEQHLGYPPSPTHEVDHIVPASFFNVFDPAQIQIAFNPENLRWVTARQNREKKDKIPDVVPESLREAREIALENRRRIRAGQSMMLLIESKVA